MALTECQRIFLVSDRVREVTASNRSTLPRVAIVVLNYNGWRDTIDCLRSLQKLEYPSFKVLVVDNDSQNDSVVQILEIFPDTELLQTDRNLGFAGGNNRGIEHLGLQNFDFFWLLNNDTVIAPHALAGLINVAMADPLVGAVGSVLLDMRSPSKVLAWGGGRLFLNWGHQRLMDSPSQNLSYLSGASMLLRSEALDQVGLLDDTYFFLWEDVDLSLRLSSAGWKLNVSDESKVWHKEGGTSEAYSPFRMEQHARGLVILLRKHALLPWLSAIPILFYYLLIVVKTRRGELLKSALRGWRAGWRIPKV